MLLGHGLWKVNLVAQNQKGHVGKLLNRQEALKHGQPLHTWARSGYIELLFGLFKPHRIRSVHNKHNP